MRKVLFSGAPRFNEFVVETKDGPYKINERLLAKKIVGGFPRDQEVLSGTGQCVAVVLHRNVEQRTRSMSLRGR